MLLPQEVRVCSEEVRTSMQLDEATPGKCQRRSPVILLVAGTPSPLFQAYDFSSGTNFLVDTGSQLSIVPASSWDKCHATRGQPLVAANGTSIATFGTCAIPLRLGTQTFQWPFTVTDVTQPIIGTDFLWGNSLVVDICGQ